MPDVRRDLVLAGVGERTGAGRELGSGLAERDAALRILVRLREGGPVAPVGERGQLHMTGRRTTGRPGERIALAARGQQLEAAEARERVGPPGAVVDVRRHRLAVLAVVRDGEPDPALLRD